MTKLRGREDDLLHLEAAKDNADYVNKEEELYSIFFKLA